MSDHTKFRRLLNMMISKPPGVFMMLVCFIGMSSCSVILWAPWVFDVAQTRFSDPHDRMLWGMVFVLGTISFSYWFGVIVATQTERARTNRYVEEALKELDH